MLPRLSRAGGEPLKSSQIAVAALLTVCCRGSIPGPLFNALSTSLTAAANLEVQGSTPAPAEILTLIEYDHVVDAHEALALGLIDKILFEPGVFLPESPELTRSETSPSGEASSPATPSAAGGPQVTTN